MEREERYTGFLGQRRVASGGLLKVALKLKALVDRGEEGITLIDDTTGSSVLISLDGNAEAVQARVEHMLFQQAGGSEPERKGPGRPKLGVVSREISLLPRHWEWLGEQPGGPSATLRRLVDQARRDNEAKDRARRARDAVYRFMHAMAGDLPGFEEATRALYAGDAGKIEAEIRPWPKDIRDHTRKLLETAQQLAREAEAAEARKGRD